MDVLVCVAWIVTMCHWQVSQLYGIETPNHCSSCLSYSLREKNITFSSSPKYCIICGVYFIYHTVSSPRIVAAQRPPSKELQCRPFSCYELQGHNSAAICLYNCIQVIYDQRRQGALWAHTIFIHTVHSTSV